MRHRTKQYAECLYEYIKIFLTENMILNVSYNRIKLFYTPYVFCTLNIVCVYVYNILYRYQYRGYTYTFIILYIISDIRVTYNVILR